MRKKQPEDLRSHRWFGANDLRSIGHRSRTKQMGFGADDYAGKPVIAILNTWSDANPCHAHFRLRAEEVKRGVWQAGGFPLEMPVLSLGETFMKPSPMLYRNLLAMEVEELLRANPIDGAVLLGGCDKTVPGLLMAAASANLPAIFLPAGPMLRGYWRGQTLASGSDVWKYWAEKRAGTIDDCAWREIEDGIARSFGTCMTMGTASTMASAAEALGMTLPGAAATPAADSHHPRLAAATGRRIVEMVWEDLTPCEVMSTAAFENAVTAVVGDGRLDQRDHSSRRDGAPGRRVAGSRPVRRAVTPYAGARQHQTVRRVPDGRLLLRRRAARRFSSALRDLLALDAVTVNGRTLGENIAGARVYNDDVIAPRDRPLQRRRRAGGAPRQPGAGRRRHQVTRPRSRGCSRTRARRWCSCNYADLAARIDDPDLVVTADSVLVLQNAGPQGGPGMPEWGMLPIPKKLLQQGVRDMVRVSDARMSGTAYGACVLHVAPESFVGGPLACVSDGDPIELNVPERRLTLHVDGRGARATARRVDAAAAVYPRGYGLALHAPHHAGARGLRLRLPAPRRRRRRSRRSTEIVVPAFRRAVIRARRRGRRSVVVPAFRRAVIRARGVAGVPS